MLNKKNLNRWAASFIKPFFSALFFLLCFSLIGNYASTFEPLFTGKIIDALTLKDRTAFFFLFKDHYSFSNCRACFFAFKFLVSVFASA